MPFHTLPAGLCWAARMIMADATENSMSTKISSAPGPSIVPTAPISLQHQASLASPASMEAPKNLRECCPAQWMYERIAKSIMAFEKQLDTQHEVGLRLVSFGESATLNITDMGFWEPDLLHFHGRNANGEPVVLIQHISQVNVLLAANRKLQEAPNRIGFQIVKKLEEGNAGSPPPGAESLGG